MSPVNPDTDKFLDDNGEWTSDFEKARIFDQPGEIVEWWMAHADFCPAIKVELARP